MPFTRKTVTRTTVDATGAAPASDTSSPVSLLRDLVAERRQWQLTMSKPVPKPPPIVDGRGGSVALSWRPDGVDGSGPAFVLEAGGQEGRAQLLAWLRALQAAVEQGDRGAGVAVVLGATPVGAPGGPG